MGIETVTNAQFKEMCEESRLECDRFLRRDIRDAVRDREDVLRRKRVSSKLQTLRETIGSPLLQEVAVRRELHDATVTIPQKANTCAIVTNLSLPMTNARVRPTRQRRTPPHLLSQ